MKTSRLSIFHAYDAINNKAAQKDLTKREKAFYQYCMDHHEIICDDDTPDDHIDIISATILFP